MQFNLSQNSLLAQIIPEPSFPSQGLQARGTRLISVLLNTCSFVMQVEYSQAYSPACERDHLTSNIPGQLVRITELYTVNFNFILIYFNYILFHYISLGHLLK